MGFRKNAPPPEIKSNIELTDSINSENQNILTAAKGGGISFAGRIFEYVVRFVFGVLIARVIGVEQYGLYTLAITVSLIASNIAMLGLQTGMLRFLPPSIQQKNDEFTWEIIQISVGLPLIFSIILSLGLHILADSVASLLFQDPRMVPLIKIVCLLIPLDTIGFLVYSITISYKQPKFSVMANNILAPLVKLVLAAAFLAVGFSANGVLFAQIIAGTASLLVMIYFVNSLFPLKRKVGVSKAQIKKLINYSIPVYLGWIVNTLKATFTTLTLGFLGFASGVGIFTAASRFSLIGSMFYLAIGNISTPIFADLHSQGKSLQIKAYYQTTARWLFIFNLPVFLTSIFFAEPLLWIFGDDFTSGAVSMTILAFGTLAYTSTGLGANILDMTDHPKVNTINSIIMVIVLITLNIIFVPRWGVIGAALATAVSTFLINIFCLIEVWFLCGIQPYNQSFLKPLIAGFTASLFTITLNLYFNLSYIPQLILGGGLLWSVYIIGLFILKFNHQDLLVLEKVINRGKRKFSIRNNLAK